MATNTQIPYADKSQNWVVGCDPVSAGCKHCYAMHWAWRMMGNPAVQHVYGGTVRKSEGGLVQWTGELNFVEKAITAPEHWKTPQTVFVNTMSDCFHPGVKMEWWKKAWDSMQKADHHRYLIFTKRPERIEEVISLLNTGGKEQLEHILFIVTVENQEMAEKRIPLLWNMPNHYRFGISFEPLLTPIDLSFIGTGVKPPYEWAIVGGESGSQARPADVDWFLKLLFYHRDNRVKFYMKQYGSYLAKRFSYFNPKGENPLEWSEALRVREVPRWHGMPF